MEVIARKIEVERPSPETISSITAATTESLKTRVEVGEAVSPIDALTSRVSTLNEIDDHGSQHDLRQRQRDCVGGQ